MKAWAALLLLPTVLLGLPQGGIISGRVRDQADKPLANVRVALAELDENGRPLKDPVYTALGKTDNDGNFRLESIPHGRYALVAGAVANPTYYPGTTKPDEARILTVGPGTPLPGFEFRLLTSLPSPQASPRPLGNGLRSVRNVSIFDVPGKLLLEGGGQIQANADVFVVTLTGKSGTIQTTLEYRPGLFYLTNSELDIATGGLRFTAGVGVRQDGSFYLSVPDGEYTATVSRKEGAASKYYVKSIRLGSRDLLKAETKMPPSGSEEVVITLAPCAPSIEGCNP
jgi:hypothetical protein